MAVVRREVRTLSPAYFGLVMATGIVSIASQLLGMRPFALALLWLNLAAYGALWALTLLRVAWYPWDTWQDLIDHNRGPGFFTAVAGTCVLGTQLLLLLENYRAAVPFLALGAILWLGLIYAVMTSFTIKETKPSLAEGISGAWLLAVVATQSVAVLSASLAPHWPQPYRLELNFLALSMWLWGGMLYIWMISLIFYRYTFFRFMPGDLAPPYWINMGAMAISTLAGTALIANGSHHDSTGTPDAPFLNSALPFLKGFTVFYWATGTWWIPMLAILAVWRHLYKRFPVVYDPLYWGLVFPLGMYTAATFRMAQVMNLGFLEGFPRYFVYVALMLWSVTFFGLVRRVARRVSEIGSAALSKGDP